MRTQFDLRDYVAVLRRQRWVILLVLVVVLGVGMGLALLQTPIYRGTAELAIEPASSVQGDDTLVRVLFGETELETQLRIASSGEVVAATRERLGLSSSPEQIQQGLDVELVEDTRVLLIHFRDPDPSRAARIAQGVAQTYLELRREEALERVLSTREGLRARTGAIRDRLNEIEDELAGSPGDDRQSLETERSSLQQQLGEISAQLTALEATDDLVRGGGEIIRAAQEPGRPIEPDLFRRGILAIAFGLLLGVTLAFVRDLLDDAVRSEHDAVRATDGVPVMSHVPTWNLPDDGNRSLPVLVAPNSPVAESFHTLRTNLRYLAVRNPFRSVLVTSAAEREGKTSVATNLAVTTAKVGTRTLLIDADLRRPTVHHAFGIDQTAGLSDLIVGDAEVGDVVQDVGITNLRVITAGDIPPNPAELLASDAMNALLHELGNMADIVIIDTAPALAVSDGIQLAPRTSAVLLVVETGSTGRRALRAAQERLERVGGNVVGTVLNRYDHETAGYSYIHYGSSDDGQPKRTLFGRSRDRAGANAPSS